MFSLQELMILWLFGGKDKIIMKEKFFYIDFIKVISCIAVILFHVNMHSFYADQNAHLLFGLKLLNINLGDIAVSLFIIVSGFGLGLSNRNSFSIKNYAKKRFLAIYPSFWISYSVVAITFLFIFGKSIGEGENPLKFILTIVGLDGLFLYKFPSFYLVGEWYTGYMILTYFLFPFLFIYALRKPLLSLCIILFIMIVLHINYNAIFEMWEPINPLMRLFEFFFGILFANFLRKDYLLRAILTTASIFILFNTNLLLDKIPYHFVLVMVGLSFFLCISSAFELIEKAVNLGHIETIISHLAKYSFLAFLVHHQIILYFYRVVPDFAHANVLLKLAVFITVITLSFSYGYVIFPLVNYVTNFLNKKVLSKL